MFKDLIRLPKINAQNQSSKSLRKLFQATYLWYVVVELTPDTLLIDLSNSSTIRAP